MSLELILDKSKSAKGCKCACCGNKMKSTNQYKLLNNYFKIQDILIKYKKNQYPQIYPKIHICPDCIVFDKDKYKKNDDLERIKKQINGKLEFD